MSASVVIAAVVIGLSLGLFGLAVLTGPDRVRQRSVANLQRGLAVPGAVDESAEPPQSLLAGLVERLTSPVTRRRIDRLLAQAGRPAAWPPERVAAMKVLLGLTIGVLAILYVRATGNPLLILLGLVATVLAYFVPELLVLSKGQERSQTIQLELADTLDQMTIAVEAGLGFDAAMSRAAKNGTGPLAEELTRTLQDIQMGQSRRQSYESLIGRTNVSDLRRFVRAIIQADQFGIAVADVLRTQANEMRLKRRQRAEEKAMQVPVKVIFPLLLCILPVLFIVLLGPAVMDIAKAFGAM